jgi:hypothetical protein
VSNVQWYRFAPGSSAAESHVISDPAIAFFTPNMIVGCAAGPGTDPTGAPTCASPFAAFEFTGSSPTSPASAYFMLTGGVPTRYELGSAGYSAPGYSSGGPNLWGDYPGVSTDPGAPGTVWVMGEYPRSISAWGMGVAALTPVAPSLSVSLAAKGGATLSLSGHGYAAGEMVQVRFNCPAPTCAGQSVLAVTRATGSGSFSNVRVSLPDAAKTGAYTLGALGLGSGVFASQAVRVQTSGHH